MMVACVECDKQTRMWPWMLVKRPVDVNNFTCRQCKWLKTHEVRSCPICGIDFKAFRHEKKITCSYACSNKLFRTGENNGNWREDAYRSTCFAKHKKECIVCGEQLIVDVHHFNLNHDDNRVENLVPLCPTHHKYIHSRHAYLIADKINEYVKEFSSRV